MRKTRTFVNSTYIVSPESIVRKCNGTRVSILKPVQVKINETLVDEYRLPYFEWYDANAIMVFMDEGYKFNMISIVKYAMRSFEINMFISVLNEINKRIDETVFDKIWRMLTTLAAGFNRLDILLYLITQNCPFDLDKCLDLVKSINLILSVPDTRTTCRGSDDAHPSVYDWLLKEKKKRNSSSCVVDI